MKELILAILILLALTIWVGEEIKERESKVNPFAIGQTIIPSELAVNNPALRKKLDLAKDSVQVINLTDELVRVLFNDDSEGIFEWRYFKAKSPLKLTEDWILGNPFSPGQSVCSIEQGVQFPPHGIIERVVGEYVTLVGIGMGMYHFSIFQPC